MRVCPHCRSIYQRASERCGLDQTLLIEQEADPCVGGKIDRYDVLRRLGGGSMSIVYEARHETIGRKLALKVLYGDFASQSYLADRFFREAQAASAIKHPNIVPVQDCGRTAEGMPFIVMDLAEGETLADAMSRQSRMEPTRAARIARDMSGGLAAAHTLGFVHRDVKPANVMLVEEDGKEIAKILDFGLVRFLPMLNSPKLTASGAILGTPVYMSPEQCMGESASPASDLYALGIVLFEMLTGAPPYVDSNPNEIMRRHIQSPVPSLPDLDGLGRIVRRLLEKDPKQRLKSASTLFAQLEIYVGHDDDKTDDTVIEDGLPRLR